MTNILLIWILSSLVHLRIGNIDAIKDDDIESLLFMIFAYAGYIVGMILFILMIIIACVQ